MQWVVVQSVEQAVVLLACQIQMAVVLLACHRELVARLEARSGQCLSLIPVPGGLA